MRIVERYSHLNGEEYLLVHRPNQWREVRDVIESVDAPMCRDKECREKSRQGQMLYSPESMNKVIKTGFNARGWQERRQPFFVTSDARTLKPCWASRRKGAQAWRNESRAQPLWAAQPMAMPTLSGNARVGGQRPCARPSRNSTVAGLTVLNRPGNRSRTHPRERADLQGAPE